MTENIISDKEFSESLQKAILKRPAPEGAIETDENVWNFLYNMLQMRKPENGDAGYEGEFCGEPVRILQAAFAPGRVTVIRKMGTAILLVLPGWSLKT